MDGWGWFTHQVARDSAAPVKAWANGFVAEEGGEHADDASAELGYFAGDLSVGRRGGLPV